MSEVENLIYKFESPQQDVMLFLHQLFTQEYGLVDKVTFKNPCYYGKSWICYLKPLKNGTTEIAFMRGNELSNANGILKSDGRKQLRSLVVTFAKDIPLKKFREVVKEAMVLDEAIPYASKRVIRKTHEPNKMNREIKDYNNGQEDRDKKICNKLAKIIIETLPEAENKIWHAHPVWFLEGNPVVGYSKLKGSVRLLFWSGQTFEEEGLQKEGKFKAAEARYTSVNEINKESLVRWLEKSRDIQWDYKNIVKRKGKLVRLK